MTAEPTDVVRRNWDVIRSWQSRGDLESVAKAVGLLWSERAWALSGHTTWADAFTSEVGEPLRLSRPNRKRLHRLLTDAGMTTRAIAVVSGVDKQTVANDEAKTGEISPVLNPEPDQPTADDPAKAQKVGLDGARRVTDPVESARLTAAIVAMREGDDEMTWPQIGQAVGVTGHSAYQRYRGWRTKHPTPPPTPPTKLPTPQRISALADSGLTHMQIAAEVGVSPERVRQLAIRDGIRIAGDIHRGKQGVKTIDMHKAVGNWITQVTASMDAADAFLDIEDLTPEQAAGWAASLDEISKRFRALTRKFQHQSDPERQAHHG